METSSISGDSVRQEFLQLLVAQLRNQDPLDPMAQQDFTAQLAQFSSLEELEKLNSSFDELLDAQSSTQYASLIESATLIGRMISYHRADDLLPAQGVVTSVHETDRGVSVTVNGFDIPIDEVTRISSEDK